MDSSDRIEHLERQVLEGQAYLIYLQSQIEVLRAVFESVCRNNHIGDIPIDEYLKQALPKQVNQNLARVSDRNPLFATALERILRDAEKS